MVKISCWVCYTHKHTDTHSYYSYVCLCDNEPYFILHFCSPQQMQHYKKLKKKEKLKTQHRRDNAILVGNQKNLKQKNGTDHAYMVTLVWWRWCLVVNGCKHKPAAVATATFVGHAVHNNLFFVSLSWFKSFSMKL